MGNLKKLMAFCLTFVFFFSFANSQVVTSDVAREAAFHFMEQMNPSVRSIEDVQLSFTGKTSDNEPAWYVFTTGTRGYIIIAADELAYPLLGYSYESPFINDPSHFPPSFAWWMELRTTEMEEIRSHRHTADASTAALWQELIEGSFDGNDLRSRDVSPLLNSSWNQDCHYNELCPADAAGPCGRVYAGCVATAMSQVMYYWRFPQTGNGTSSYNCPPYGTQYVNHGITTYKWNEMKGSVNSSHPELALLLYHAGVSVGMGYSPSGSGASSWDVPGALKNKFRYSSANYRNKSSYSTTNWNNLLKGNLDNGYPVYYSGSGSAGGHAFNCDGYQGSDHFHFDWGWSGAYNGYFYLNNLNPGGNDFNSWQAAVVDIYPPSASYPQYCSGQTTLTATSGSFEDGSGPKANYNANTNCSWLIQPSVPVDYIQLNFVYIDTESGNDVITVYDGATTSDPVLGTYSGTTVPSQIQTNGQAMLVTFTSNGSVQENGFLAEYYSSPSKFCSGTTVLTSPNGAIEDGSGDDYQYANGSNCRWTIEPPGAWEFFVVFTRLDTEPVNDKVRVLDLANNVLIGEFSGNQLPGPLHIQSSKIQIHFITNTSVQGEGWALYYSLTADIDEKEAGEINIYPNPASDILNISINEQQQLKAIQVVDMSGRICFTASFNESSLNQFSIDISHLSSGIYFVELMLDEITKRQKLIISK